nr:Chain C, Marker peptide [Homo sapiens]5C09_H Chain H, Marker peptide [Homo sapiens]5C0G_C Chain C, Marker peptide [Homo sapiens]
YLGGPDFPTI